MILCHFFEVLLSVFQDGQHFVELTLAIIFESSGLLALFSAFHFLLLALLFFEIGVLLLDLQILEQNQIFFGFDFEFGLQFLDLTCIWATIISDSFSFSNPIS